MVVEATEEVMAEVAMEEATEVDMEAVTMADTEVEVIAAAVMTVTTLVGSVGRKEPRDFFTT